MDLFTDPHTVREWSERARAHGLRVGFVATMGALHDGHRGLVAEAMRRSDRCVVSIFVNPLQFDRDADLTAYPRPIDDDLAVCDEIGVDAVYTPSAATMYPAGFETTVQPGSLAEGMEGAMRAGHFAGVATVVAKLLGAVRPHIAVFGEKDFQQLVIIRRMAADLDLGVEIVGSPTVREAGGLALSSRNRRLSPAQRGAARCIPAALDAAATAVRDGTRRAGDIAATAADIVNAADGARLEYVTVFDPTTLAPLDEVRQGSRIAVAVWFGDVRLIDNREL